MIQDEKFSRKQVPILHLGTATTEEMAGIGFWTVQSTRSLNQIQTNSRLLENCTTKCDEGIHEVQKLKKRAIINCLVNSLFDIDLDLRGALFWWKTIH